MIVVMNRITVEEGKEKEFEETFATRDRAVDQMPGFMDLAVLRPGEGRTYIVMSRWKSRADFDQWTLSKPFLAAHKDHSPAGIESPPTLEIYEILTP